MPTSHPVTPIRSQRYARVATADVLAAIPTTLLAAGGSLQFTGPPVRERWVGRLSAHRVDGRWTAGGAGGPACLLVVEAGGELAEIVLELEPPQGWRRLRPGADALRALADAWLVALRDHAEAAARAPADVQEGAVG